MSMVCFLIRAIGDSCAPVLALECFASIPYAQPVDGPLNVLLLLGIGLSFLKPAGAVPTESFRGRSLIGVVQLSALIRVAGAISFNVTYWTAATAIYIAVVTLRWNSKKYSVSQSQWWPVFALFLLLELWLGAISVNSLMKIMAPTTAGSAAVL